MKKLVLYFSFLFISLACYSQEVTTYYFIRHAEKLRIDKTDKNPNLNDDGLKRAEAWKEVFSTISFDAVYSTDYSRTKLTTKGKTVLVVGHSNTTNVFANKVLGEEKYDEINDSNNSNLYIVTVIDGKPSAILLKIN